MKNLPIPRLDKSLQLLHDSLLKYCRLRQGEVWTDPHAKHKVGCLDAASLPDVQGLMEDEKAVVAVQDPPYNLAGSDRRSTGEFINWCKQWVLNTNWALAENSSLYIWIGADQNQGFQPLPEFMIMMRDTPFTSRIFITMRNQRGYGTSKNWMAVRQELLYYVKGRPGFNVEAEYTEIPKTFSLCSQQCSLSEALLDSGLRRNGELGPE